MPSRSLPAQANGWLFIAVLSLAVPAGAARAQAVSAEDFAKVQRELARQAQVIEAQQREIDALKMERLMTRAPPEGAAAEAPQAQASAAPPSPNPAAAPPPTQLAQAPPGPAAPVGERPAEQPPQVVAAIPPELGVLTPKGHLVIDPSIEYDRFSTNRLVFRGVEIVPGIQLGVIEASDVAQDTGVATLAARYGVTSRLEVEVRVPYVWRDARITTLAQRDDTITRNAESYGHDIGDVEFDARYQLNSGSNGLPIFVATSRLKPPTGTGPYDVQYDEFGVASTLATGSGFWGLEGGMTVLYASDPAILYGGLTYLHNFGRDIDKTVGAGDAAVHVGEVDPGDSIGGTLGFGVALNPRFSFSLGYAHNYIFHTTQEFGATRQVSQALQIGRMVMGLSYSLTDRVTLNSSFEFGVTADAPDVRVVFRVPYRF